MKNYYAIEYPKGVAVNATTGKPYGWIHSFWNQSDRDLFVANRGDFETGNDWRLPIKASDSFVRYCKAHDLIERH
jgi:hypothetical protein